MIDIYLEYLNKHIDKANKSFDLDQFQSGKYKKLFIVGIPASGKTSTSHILEKKYNIPVIHTDDLVNEKLKELTGINVYEKNKQEEIRQIAKEMNITGDMFWESIYKDKLEPILKNNKKMIVEGTIQFLYGYFPQYRSFLIKFPAIVMGKSIENSWKDRATRDGVEYKFKSKKKHKNYFQIYMKDKKKYSKNIKKWNGEI